ncbi:FMN-binding negative transcriptional regulator [Protofrankia symbiont of Coriaria ruscifolia]|uniref:Putative transcriptional repressor of sporulation and degradative enzymes production n=1 Tax=Candidatus Protofrankia californiensis TaxID=1839754 RepID=A0A1C3NZ87_9ACTN|nr:FMN-binding negative transcriptional regulator [Protofrankia symbiont of Coriaria ruscifolia]SBW22876.1 putative transcriptional repressor of sporulation and degradative enzymes production [Candidatus Protofrankia californiensis]
MLVPDIYQAPDDSWILSLIRQYPLALLTSIGDDGGLYTSQVPVILAQGNSEEVTADMTLLSHMNRSNPHWVHATEEEDSVAVFSGPHSYVSPGLYEQSGPAAPTWNFTSVHLRGVVRRLPTGEATLDVIKQTASVLEREFGTGWSTSGSIDYFNEIVAGVGAFKFLVCKVEAMFKLSQEQSPTVRRRVQRKFAVDKSTNRNDLAKMMSQLP